jgi:ribose transport system permease protein
VLAVVSLGQMLVIQQGGIDLSVPGVVSLSAVVVSYAAQEPNIGTVGAVALALGVAAIAGLLSGLLVTRLLVAPIVATLGMNALLYGTNISISGGTPVAFPDGFVGLANSRVIGVSQLVLAVAIITAVLLVTLKATPFGRSFEAIGTNPRAARAAGIEAGRYRLSAYVIAALLYAVGGIMLGGLMFLPSPQQGDGYLMPSIAAVVLGGISLFGGRGNVLATIIAALFLTQLLQLVRTTGSSIGVQYLFQGAAILIGVAIYSDGIKSFVGSLFARRRGARTG